MVLINMSKLAQTMFFFYQGIYLDDIFKRVQIFINIENEIYVTEFNMKECSNLKSRK